MTYNPKKGQELAGLPKDTVIEGTITYIEDAHVKDFV